MALDVHLTRGMNERWGFEIVGGADDETPLTVEKIQPSSPASKAGLQNGDTILTINGEEAIDFTHEEACRKVAECGNTMSLGVVRGLYDLVLDEQDPIYYEQLDLDPQSQPTEVPFKVQQFIGPEDLGSNLIEYGPITDPLGTPFDPSVLLTDNVRSLTASPFLTPTKPYRPFSTEPIPEIPDLEDPIILNPEFKDKFAEKPVDIIPDYILNGDGVVETKFKLPISEQYDPEGTKKVKNSEIDAILSKYTKMETLSKTVVATDEGITKKVVKDVGIREKSSLDIKIGKDIKESVTKEVKEEECLSKDRKEVADSLSITKEDASIKVDTASKEKISRKDVKIEEKHEEISEVVEEKVIREELTKIEKTKQEIDVSQIEETAIAIVEESIERAVSVAEEIKKEMEGETDIEQKINEKDEVTEIAEIDVVAEKSSKSEIKHAEYEQKTEKSISETVKSEGIHTEDIKKVVNKDTRVKIEEETSKTDVKESFKSNKTAIDAKIEEGRRESAEYTTGSIKSATKVTKTVTNDTKVNTAEQRSYAIGLQTIPNIRGVVHSSYHYDLLLRTFFLHLTDVMVALSRFLLTQPIFNTEKLTTQSTVSERQETTDARTRQQESVKVEKEREVAKPVQERIASVATQTTVTHESKDVRARQQEVVKVEKERDEREVKAVSRKSDQTLQERRIATRQLITPVPEEMKIESHDKVTKMDKEIIKSKEKNEIIVKTDDRKVSGAEMAQRTEKKLTKEVTKKMDAVISEFENIAVEEDQKEMFQRNRRSRSRSQVEEEVARESDPLEWLSKVNSRRSSQEVSEERLTKEFSSSERKEYEKMEKHEIVHKKAKKPKQMYLATVEAHVYTNKDVIFEDAAEFSETSSVQSAEEVNTAFEAIEAMSTENVALESAVKQIEQAQIVEETKKFVSASATSEATVQQLQEIVQESTQIKQEEYRQETAQQKTDELISVSVKSEATVQKIDEMVHESTAIKREEYKQETAQTKTDVQEVIMQEIKEIIEPVVEMREKIEKKSASISVNESLSVAESKEISISETKQEYSSVESKTERAAVIQEEERDRVTVETKQIMEPQVEIEEVSAKLVLKTDKDFTQAEESAALKIVKEEETELESDTAIIEIEEQDEQNIVKKIEMSQALQLDNDASEITSKMSESTVSKVSEFSKNSSTETDMTQMTSNIEISSSKQTDIRKIRFDSEISDVVQESSFTAKAVDKKLTIRTDLSPSEYIEGPPSTIDTPTPSTVPPTPLTDEYVFKVSIPLPKTTITVTRDCTPDDEDPHIVKKKLIPHIETEIEEVVYDPPLPTPPSEKLQSPIFKTPGLFGGGEKPVYKIRFPPVYRKPGLFGGADRPEYNVEEIREIERKSSLLASAIDQTIKSIEEYKEEVGMEKKKEIKTTEERVEKNYSKEVIIESKENGFDETNTIIEEVIEKLDEIVAKNGRVQNNGVKIEEMITEQEENATMNESEIKLNELKKESIETSKINGISQENEQTDVKIDENQTKSNTTNIMNGVDHQNGSKEENVIVNSTASPKSFDNSDVNSVSVKVAPETENPEAEVMKEDPLLRVRPVVFDPESIQKRGPQQVIYQPHSQDIRQSPYITETGEVMGTNQGIVDGLDEPVMDADVAKEIGKPGISEEKIAELISGEAEMLREAHVMGLTRVLKSHMHRPDDSSVDFQKIKPMIGSLKDSEVLKLLNEELERKREEERKKEEKKWTTFLQKPKRPVPKAKFGYHGWTQNEQALVTPEEPYKVKIVKQAKPKVAPDYKPEEFDTGPLPWEQRAEVEASLPPVEPEEPILIPEVPEFLEAVDPLKESEVPDLEDTGLPLPPPKEPTPPPEEEQPPEETPAEEPQPQVEAEETKQEDTVQEESREDMENKIAEQLVKSVQGMVDPNAPVDQQLAQMRAQLAALAQLPEVIQQTLAMVSQQLNKMAHQETQVEATKTHTEMNSCQELVVHQTQTTETQELKAIENVESTQTEKQTQADAEEIERVTVEEVQEKINQQPVQQEIAVQERRVETPVITEEDMRQEKIKKEQYEKAKLEAEARQLKQRPTPRVGKPKRVFGPPDPDSRPVVLPGGRRWRKTSDVYNEQMIAETMQAQAELINGKTMGFESDLLPYDSRINFMKYEKPPVSLDHLQNSATYKLVHDMDKTPLKRVELLTPVIAEADYRERCRSTTPSGNKPHMQISQQFHP